MEIVGNHCDLLFVLQVDTHGMFTRAAVFHREENIAIFFGQDRGAWHDESIRGRDRDFSQYVFSQEKLGRRRQFSKDLHEASSRIRGAGNFADAANNHGFKRARWRRLWRQQIQDYLIAAIQNIRILLARTVLRPAADNVLDLKSWRGGRVGLGVKTLWFGNAWKMFWQLNRRQPSIFSLN